MSTLKLWIEYLWVGKKFEKKTLISWGWENHESLTHTPLGSRWPKLGVTWQDFTQHWHSNRSAVLAALPHRWPPAHRPVLAENTDSLSSRTGCSGMDEVNLYLHQDVMGSVLQGTIWPAGLGALPISAGTDGISPVQPPVWTNRPIHPWGIISVSWFSISVGPFLLTLYSANSTTDHCLHLNCFTYSEMFKS